MEIPWTLNHAKGEVLDVGCYESTYLNDLEGPVDGVDVRGTYVSGVRDFYRADIRTWEPPRTWPTVLAVSTIEHIGLEHISYGIVADDEHGDKRAIEGCLRALDPDGQLLVTVPFGEPGIFGWWRRYSLDGIAELFDGLVYRVEYMLNPAWPVGGVALIRAHR